MITGSQWARVLVCEAAGVLPQVDTVGDEYAARGTAIHQYLATAGTLGRDEALRQAPEIWREACAALALDELPQVDPRHYAHEVAFAFDFSTMMARELHRGGGRDYSMVRPSEVPITLDVVGLTYRDERPYAGVIIDWKTGHKPVEAAVRNPQLRYGALCLSTAFRLEYVRVAIGYVRDEGAWFDYAEFDPLDLYEIAQEFTVAHRRIVAAHEAHVAGAHLQATTGPHCTHCPSFPYCPAQVGLAVRFGGDSAALEIETKRMLLSPEVAAHAVRRLMQAKQVLGRIEAALRAHATDRGGIDMGDGTKWGPQVTTREELVGSVVREVVRTVAQCELAAMHARTGLAADVASGTAHDMAAAIAEDAISLDSTKKQITAAAKTIARLTGGKAAPLEREMLASIRERGGAPAKVRTEFGLSPIA